MGQAGLICSQFHSSEKVGCTVVIMDYTRPKMVENDSQALRHCHPRGPSHLLERMMTPGLFQAIAGISLSLLQPVLVPILAVGAKGATFGSILGNTAGATIPHAFVWVATLHFSWLQPMERTGTSATEMGGRLVRPPSHKRTPHRSKPKLCKVIPKIFPNVPRTIKKKKTLCMIPQSSGMLKRKLLAHFWSLFAPPPPSHSGLRRRARGKGRVVRKGGPMH